MVDTAEGSVGHAHVITGLYKYLSKVTAQMESNQGTNRAFFLLGVTDVSGLRRAAAHGGIRMFESL